MRLRTLVIAGLLTLVAGIVVAFPARIAYQWTAPPGVALSGISGSLWNGAAREASAGGIYLSDLRWHFHPLALFAGRAEFAVSGTPAGGFVEADLAAGFDGSLRLSDVNASLPISAFEGVAPVSGLAGSLDVRLERLVVDKGFPVDASGAVELSGLVVRPLSPTPLGDFRATLQSADDVVRGDVEDLGGVLDVTGTIELRADRSYVLVGLVSSRPGAPAAVDEQLRYLGSPDAEGRRRFRLEGQL